MCEGRNHPTFLCPEVKVATVSEIEERGICPVCLKDADSHPEETLPCKGEITIYVACQSCGYSKRASSLHENCFKVSKERSDQTESEIDQTESERDQTESERDLTESEDDQTGSDEDHERSYDDQEWSHESREESDDNQRSESDQDADESDDGQKSDQERD